MRVPLPPRPVQQAVANFLDALYLRLSGQQLVPPELPLPLTEQGRVVARIEEIAAQIHKARALRQQAAVEAAALIASRISNLFQAGAARGWPERKLGDYVLGVCYGTSEKTSDDDTGVPILRMGNIQNGDLDLSKLKYLHLSPRDRRALSLQGGDILVNRTNSAKLVGKCAVFEIEGEFSFASYLIRLRLDRQRAEPRLVASYINSPLGRAYMLNEKRQMTGQANVNSTELKSLPIALPSLAEQRTILAELDALNEKVNALQHVQLSSLAELDALLPAILDRAFNGEP